MKHADRPAMEWATKIAKSSWLGRVYLVPRRASIAASYYVGPLRSALSWVARAREYTNFTYDLDATNRLYLASFVTAIARISLDESLAFLAEIDGDVALAEHIRKTTLATNRHHTSELRQPCGRRIGWYALVRALRPKLVVETGIDKGLGACVLAAALLRNAAEGHPGRYVGTDINPQAGYLFTKPYTDVGEIVYGDSIESLIKLEQPIDFFVNDSDHSSAYEAAEYDAIASNLAPGAVVLGDNAHATDALWRFARRSGRDFLFFKEKPKDHWYPGGGIGAAFDRR